MGTIVLKKRAAAWLACLTALTTSACGEPVEPDLSAYNAAGPAEIPVEILGELDEQTLEKLVEEPKYVALTFDDGPKADTTGRLLDGLLERGAEGHQIGNHTYSHTRLSKAERDTVVEEIHKTEVLLQSVVGAGSFWLRPPYGAIDTQRAALVKTPMIYWSVDPQDWKLLDAEKVVQAAADAVKPGDIILLHDFYPTSVDAALALIDRLQEEGYAFVTVEELFRIQGVEPQNGVLYASPVRTRGLS